MTTFLALTSDHGTPLIIRSDVIIYIEGFDFNQRSNHPSHRGCRLTLLAGQFAENIHALETVEHVADMWIKAST